MAMKVLSLEIKKQAQCLFREMENLEKLQQLDNPHLIKPIAVCTTTERASFFFPWADEGDLSKFWEVTDPGSREDTVPWMLDQMVGLGGAMKLLAENNCRHSDLKPQNILLFRNCRGSWTLKITDLGISKFHILATTRRLDPTSAQHVTVRYCPPEFGILNPERVKRYIEGSDTQRLSRRFDIWSLGCIFFEFLIWVRLGQKNYKTFNKSMGKKDYTKFWVQPSTPSTPESSGSGSESLDAKAPNTLDFSGYHLHGIVSKSFTKLEEAQKTSDDPAIHAVLQLVRNSMLVIDQRNRCSASDVHDSLKAIRDEGKFSSLLNGSTKPIGLPGDPFLDVPLRDQQLSAAGNTATLRIDIGAQIPISSSEGLTTTAIPRDNAAAQKVSLKKQISDKVDQGG